MRPGPDSTRRLLWNLLHHNLGRLAVLAAWANCSLGIYLAHAHFMQVRGRARRVAVFERERKPARARLACVRQRGDAAERPHEPGRQRDAPPPRSS